ncbi:MAG: right-handed parallel beta-helix repeat-containing protein [Candidatus Woesearchaeota archaeon]
MDSLIPESHSKHHFKDMIMVFIIVMVVAPFLMAAVKEAGHRDIDLRGQAFAISKTIECFSCASCTEALSNLEAEKVILTADIYTGEGTCIAINSFENKRFDCSLNSIDGANTRGSLIEIRNSKNIIVENCVLDRKENAITLFESTNSKILANKISYAGSGIEVLSSSNNEVAGNEIIKPSTVGIFVEGVSDNNLFEKNNVWYSDNYGIRIADTRSILLNNEFCFSRESDIFSIGVQSTNFGSLNSCDSSKNWKDQDINADGCTRKCID